MSNVPKKPEVLSLGWIPYWNLYPLKRELLKHYGSNLSLQPGKPALVNRFLEEGLVNIAPCSSICLLRNPHHEMAMPLGVASDGEVASVYLGIQEDDETLFTFLRERQRQLAEITLSARSLYSDDMRLVAQHVAESAAMLQLPKNFVPPHLQLTPASAASATLAKIFYRMWFGDEAYQSYLMKGSSGITPLINRTTLELLIGDEALSKRSSFTKILDLGTLWKDLTGLPFVFAVWQSTRSFNHSQWKKRILAAAELAQVKMRVEPTAYLPDTPVLDEKGKPIDLAGYWKLIQYRLTPTHIKGLLLYLCLARNLVAQPADDNSAMIKIMRWQQLGDEAFSAT